MKGKLFLFTALLGMLIFLEGCKKEPSTGGLTIRVTLNGSSSNIQGAFVGIGTSLENLHNSLYTAWEQTDASGEATFSDLKPELYYYEGYLQVGGVQYYKEGPIMIVAGKHIDLPITLE
ncbi:MAG: hypothetical protein WCL06_13730 [Bacteroidota bacterium]